MRLKTLSFLMAAPILAISASAYADVRVTIYHGSRPIFDRSFPSAGDTIVVQDGDIAYVSYSDGSVDQIPGYYSGPISERGDGGPNPITRTTRGGSRGPEDQSSLPVPADVQPLDISLDTNLTQCYVAGSEAPHIWQHIPQPGQDKVVLSYVDGSAALVDFKGADRAPWPQDVNLTGKEGLYVVSRLDPDSATQIFRLKVITLPHPDKVTSADLEAQGCLIQAKIMKARGGQARPDNPVKP